MEFFFEKILIIERTKLRCRKNQENLLFMNEKRKKMREILMKKKPIGIIFLISFNQLASLAKLPLNLNLEIKLNHTKSEFRLKVNIFWYN